MRTQHSLSVEKKLFRIFSFYVPLFCLSLFFINGQGQATCLSEDYEAVPPFLTTKVKPNVMFMLDNSGSMKQNLYSSGWKCGSVGTDFDSNKSYFGIFEDTKNYSYDASIPVDSNPYGGIPYNVAVDTSVTGAFVEDSCSPGAGVNCWNGNFLNWMVTRRMDAARKVLVGGKVESRDGYDYIGGDSGDLEWKIVGNNERSDNLICKADSSGQSYTPFPDNTQFTVYSPADNGASHTVYDPYAKLSINGAILDNGGAIIGEAGTVSSFKNTWKTVTLARAYTNPVVIAKPLSYNGGDPSVVRIKNAAGNSFSIMVEEWEYKDGGHTNESISYMVVEQGVYTLAGGGKVVAGTASVDTSWQTVSHNAGLIAPVVLCSVTSENGGDTVTTRIRNIGVNSFDVILQEEENLGGHTSETVGYIAIEQGNRNLGAGLADVGSVSNVNNAWKTINFGLSGSGMIFLADMQTTDDTDTATLRYRNLGSSSVEIFVEEEKSADSEITHNDEDVGYIAIVPFSFNLALVVEEEPTGLIHDVQEDVRLGISFYRYQKDSDIYNGEWAHGGTMSLNIPKNPFVKNPDAATGYRTIETPVKSDVATMVDAIEHFPLVWGTTPLAENYFEVIRYFQQEDPYYDDKPAIGTDYDYLVYDSSDDDPASLWDPYYFSEYSDWVRCVKSFVILFTDGAPYRDDYVPDNLADYDFDDYDGDNKSGDCFNSGNNDNTCKDNLDDLAYWANWDSTNNMNRDLRTDLDGEQYLTTYTVAFGSSSIPAILQNTADNGNGTAYAAEDGAELQTALRSVMTDILKRTSAGSSISVLSERATSGSVIHQALFFPEKTYTDGASSYTVDWVGALNSYWFYNTRTVSNIREDTVNSYYLDTFDDNVIDFKIDATGTLEIDYYNTIHDGSSDDGAMDSLQGTHISVDDVPRIWEGGEILKDTDEVDRKIYGLGINASGNEEMLNFANVEATITVNNYEYFDDYFGLSSSGFPSCLGDAFATDEQKARNLISYTRGETDDFSAQNGSACRSRVVNNNGDIWKLGDIIHSSPRVVDYEDISMLFTGSNDGMLHAFTVGKIRRDGTSNTQTVRLCDTNTGACTLFDIGKEMWAFIPKNAMPYLKYLADPEYCHMYTVDMAPYYIESGDKKILIGGMRFGGATGCNDGSSWCDSDQITPPDCTPATVGSCVGLSSYFALDITDPDNPEFLWEYTHPGMGFSYSGPAYMKRGTKNYIMVTSGPTHYEGKADGQMLKMFIMELDSDFKMVDPDSDGDYDEHVFKIDGAGKDAGFAKSSVLSKFNNAFGGRMFTDGIDYDGDGNTEIVFFGVNWFTSGEWKGNVIGVVPNNSDPVTGTTINWEIASVFNQGQSPITSKVAYGDCFGSPFIYFGTGRWFYKEDSPGQNINDTESLYGVKIKGCLDALVDGDASTDCTGDLNFNSAHADQMGDDVCNDINDTNTAWQVSDLEPIGGGYYKERTITDPTVSDSNIVFFTTTQPSSDICSFGGRARIWAFNCQSAHSIWEGCSGTDTPDIPPGALLLQLSGGNIEDATLDKNKFTEEDNLATDWMVGIPPESATPFVPYGGSLTGEIILWLER